MRSTFGPQAPHADFHCPRALALAPRAPLFSTGESVKAVRNE